MYSVKDASFHLDSLFTKISLHIGVDYSQPSAYQFTSYSELVGSLELAITCFVQLLVLSRLAMRI
jgi:hypothetical protein